MCKKLICLVSFVLVLGVTAGVANAYLVAYWPMDEGTGTTVGDVTGAWDGTITGNVTWVYGIEGMALEFPGGQNYVNCGNVEIGPDLTLAYWCFNPEKAFERSIGQHSANYTADPGWCVYSRNEGEGTVWFRVHGVDWWYGGDIIIPDILPKTEWYHLAFTFEGATRELKGYLDGELKVSNICEAGRSIHPNTNDLRMGYVGTGEPFSGMLDEVAVWNHVLTEDEILAVMEGYIGGANPNASRPVPADGALLSDTGVNLSWSPGGYAVSHDVYFGDNFDDVNAGTGDTFQGNQTATRFRVGSSKRYPYLPDLAAGTTYYWRIDEVNDTHPESPWKGNIWSFMTPPKTAYDPYPVDGAEFFIDPNVTLSWTAGYGAKLHHVYFGDNFADVNDADKSDTTGIYRGAQETITYTPGPLGLDSLYYWRVDEDTAKRVEKTHKGDVWSFRTIQPIPITDPNLICWWTFDEGTGVTAFDWSGHGNNGTFNNDPEWVDGYHGYALYLGGDFDPDTVVYYFFGAAEPWPAGTVALWVKVDTVGQNQNSGAFSSHLPNTSGFQIDVDGTYPGNYRYRGESNHLIGPVTTEWVHLAAAWDGTSMNFYYNGSSAGSLTVAAVDTTFNRFAIGTNRNVNNWLAATIDDFRVYDKTLSDAEIYALGAPPNASAPSPADGATDVTQTPTLRWTAGGRALQHDVYFGTDEEAVRNANMRSPEYKDTKDLGSESYEPGKLEWNTAYYWRVDEVEATRRVDMIHKGDVWSFRTKRTGALEPAALHVEGSRIKTDDGNAVRLQGVNVASLEWSNTGDRQILESVRVAIYDWNSNTIRLPLSQERWFGEAEGQSDDGRLYRLIVDEVIQYISENECHVIIDLHCSRCGERWGSMPDMGSVDFWKSVATRYADEPAVLFGLYNEPHDVSWDTWKSGGWITEPQEVGGETYMAPGMQELLDTVRSTGASNIAVVGGLEWGYDLRGIPEYALDDPYGNVMYDTHIYPWKGNEEDWDGRVGHVIGKYPILVGEVGCDPDSVTWPGYDPYTWAVEVLTYIHKHGLNWTAWCFHPSAGPPMLKDWTYEPTPYWGVFVKRALEPVPYISDAALRARDPSPADGATDVTQTPTLRWTAGDRALQHDVYFGTDEEAVRNANMRSPEYKDTKDLGSGSYEPGKLDWNTTYYWRVDEYNTDATISEGRVWSFTVVVMTDPLADALDTDLSFTTGGSEDWFGQTATSYYGGDAAQSGDISDSEDSWIQTTVSGTGTVKFYWKVSSEDNFDFLEFYIDGSLQDRISGSVDWEQRTYTISTSGLHTLEWRYVKDDSNDSGSDCGWVDKMEWVTN